MKPEILSLTDEQNETLARLLNYRGFDLRASGHIKVIEWGRDFPRNEDGLPFPIAYLTRRALFLVNLDEQFPEDYHGRLRQLYQEVIG